MSATSASPKYYMVHFAIDRKITNFILQEFESLCELLSIKDQVEINVKPPFWPEKDKSPPPFVANDNPFLWVRFPSDQAMCALLQRSVTIAFVVEVWCISLDSDFSKMKECIQHACKSHSNFLKTTFAPNSTATFRIDNTWTGKKVKQQERLQKITQVAEIVFPTRFCTQGSPDQKYRGVVDLSNPTHVFHLFEDYGSFRNERTARKTLQSIRNSDASQLDAKLPTTGSGWLTELHTDSERAHYHKSSLLYTTDKKRSFVVQPDWYMFGVQVGTSARRHLTHQYSLKTRDYIGTTSMDAKLSFLVANQALVRRGMLVLDPFAGTGSILVSCAVFGSMTMGCDIDLRALSSPKNDLGIVNNFAQYKITSKLAGLFVQDISNHAWRKTPLFDAIVADPPYGIREPARKVISKQQTTSSSSSSSSSIDQPTSERPPKRQKTSTTQPHVRVKHHRPSEGAIYEFADIICDLMDFALEFLVLKGRLVFWVPSTYDFDPIQDLPIHPCLKFITSSGQGLTKKYQRVLVTMEKCCQFDPTQHPAHVQLPVKDSYAHSSIPELIFGKSRAKRN